MPRKLRSLMSPEELDRERERDRIKTRLRRQRLYAKGLNADGKPCNRPRPSTRVEVEEPHVYTPRVCRVHL